jgi:hypothetical protein
VEDRDEKSRAGKTLAYAAPSANLQDNRLAGESACPTKQTNARQGGTDAFVRQLSEDEPMLYCPVCSTRLAERKCKLFCERCGYYMSCADYY